MKSSIHSIITTTALTLGTLWFGHANAADNTETVRGMITLGATGYGVRLDDGKVIRFMGRGGNTVFAVCHNGDTCEITGVVIYTTNTPLFVSVTRARKLAGPVTPKKVAPTPPPNTEDGAPSPDNSDSQSPFLLDGTTNGHRDNPIEK